MHHGSAGEATPFATPVDVLRWRAEHQAERLACTFLDEELHAEAELTYAELDERARAIAAALAPIAVPGDRALLLHPPGLDFICAYLGCAYAGVIAVPVDVPRPGQTSPRLAGLVDDARPSVVLTIPEIVGLADKLSEPYPGLAAARWVATREVPSERAADGVDRRPTADDVLMLQYTSGSTRRPRGVVLSHGNLMANSAGLSRCKKHGPHARAVSWLPHYHDMGLIGTILHPLIAGVPTFQMSPLAFVQRPIRWLRAISKIRATVSGAPNFAYDLCVQRTSPAEREGLDLSSWELAFNGAEPVRPRTLERFVEEFRDYGFRAETFFPCYGMAEATLVISGGPKETSWVLRDRPRIDGERDADLEKFPVVSCGPPIEEGEVVIVDRSRRRALPDGEVGEIWLAGPCVAQGYWKQGAASAETFGARLVGDSRGPFLRTGDLGFTVDGEVYVCGRLKEMIIVAGINHHPEDIERTVDECHGWLETRRCAAFSVGEDGTGEELLVVAIELDRSDWERLAAGELDVERLEGDVLEAVVQHHRVRVHDVVLVPPRVLPLTTSGKVQRRACRSGYLDGSLLHGPPRGSASRSALGVGTVEHGEGR